MKKETVFVTVDSRNRITIPKGLAKNLAQMYRVSVKNEQIILDPIKEIPHQSSGFLNQKINIFDELKKALKQKADIAINLDDFEKK